MSSIDPLKARYDETPYRDSVFQDLDLSRLLGLVHLFGLGPNESDCGDLRVLDLACSSGNHIRQQAARYPGVRFTGVDFSSSEVEAGQKAITESGATNVELMLSDLREFEVPQGVFDVIICQGAFSWVPDEVKDRIFELCRSGLKRTGVSSIAYLTYPGWKQREAIRELLAFRTREIDDPKERVRESALLLRLLHAGYEANEESAHAQSLKAVVENMQRSSANVFLHDELGGIHDPCYFVQFVEWAAEWGMQYLAESNLGAMVLDGLPSQAAGLLQKISPDFLETQQLIDFLVNRSGRTSLMVRDDAPVARELSVDALAGLGFTTNLLPTRETGSSCGSSRRFETLRGGSVEIEGAGNLAMLERMLDTTEAAPTLDDLVSCCPDAPKSLLGLIARGLVDPLLSLD